MGKQNKKYNTYDLSGEYGIGYTTKGEEFYFDLDDYNKIKDYCWCLNKSGYLVARDCKNKCVICIHVLIMNPEKGKVIDHKNHNKKDNRKKNLRVCFQLNNTYNSALREDNSSGAKGVYWNEKKTSMASLYIL